MILKAGVTSLNNQRAAHYLITGLALVLPLSRLLISSLTILIVAFWIVQAKPWQHLKALINSKLGITLIAFILFSALSLLWTENTAEGIDVMRKYGWWLLIPAVAYLSDGKTIQSSITAFLIGMTGSQLISWLMHFNAWPFELGLSQYGPTPFMNHIEYSLMLVCTIAILVTRLAENNTGLMLRLLHYSLFVSALLSLLVVDGKTGQIAFFKG